MKTKKVFDFDSRESSLAQKTLPQLLLLKEILLRCRARQAELSVDAQVRLYKLLELVEYHLLKLYYEREGVENPFTHPFDRVSQYVGIGAHN